MGLSKNEKVRVGIIGCGGIGNGKHLNALRNQPDVEVVAFCDLIEERAAKSRAQYGTDDAKVYLDYRKLLEDKSIDSVHVCTPNRSHSFITVDALEAGKHVMCEKPMAINAAEAKLMLDASIRTGKVLTIGYQNRQLLQHRIMKKMCEENFFGDIYYAKALAIRRRGVPTWGVFIDEYEQGGGPLIDIGTHSLDLTLWAMNNYKPKYCLGQTFHKLNHDTDQGNGWGRWDPEKFTCEDSAFGFIVMENGAVINLESSWALNIVDSREATTVLCGTKGGVDFYDGMRINGVKYDAQYIEKVNTQSSGAAFFPGMGNPDPSVAECRLFYDAIRYGTEPSTLPEQAYVVSQILDGIYTSAKTGDIFRF